MIGKIFKKVIGTQNDRELRRLRRIVKQINDLETDIQALTDQQLKEKTIEFRQRLADGEVLNNLIPEAFAVVREASVRTLGLRHFDVQLIGGMVLNDGKIAEMRTGEGKTLVSTLAVYLNALPGKGAHVVTVNDYLARRDGHWMAPIFNFLGMSIGIIQSSGALGPDDSSFVYDVDYSGAIENFKHLKTCSRKEAYAQDITYGTNNEFGFDYLRDNMVLSIDDKTQRGLAFAVVDEVDSILIDEARTPLVISGAAEDSSKTYLAVNKVVPLLKEQKVKPERDEIVPEEDRGDFILDEKTQTVELTEEGHEKVEDILIKNGLLAKDQNLYSAQNLGLLHHVHAALRAHHLYHRDQEYIVQEGEVILIDQHTGRKMAGRRMGEGMHQALEAKEKVRIQNESQTMASTTFQNYFRLYDKLSGMTGTADTEAVEFHQIYNLQVVAIPTNNPIQRKDYNDLIYLSKQEKLDAVVADVAENQARGAPVLVGTITIEASEEMSLMLKKAGIKHQVLNAKFHEKEAQIVAEAGRPGAVTIATNMAGRGTDIVLGGNLEAEIAALGDKVSESDIEAHKKEWKKRQEIVMEAGGLHIIGTERHESRRIDNQLRGRSGRQGDPGASRFYLSMDDSLMRLFASDRVRNMMQSIGMEHGEAIEHRMVTSSIEKAQRKVEGRNFDIRKQLLEYDDVSNDQRHVIYSQRSDLLSSEDISDVIERSREEVVFDLVAQHIPLQSMEETWDVEGLETKLSAEFGTDLPIKKWLEEDKTLETEALASKVQAEFSALYAQKLTRLPDPSVARRLERDLMLQVMDKLWKDHLATMDQLRAGINLRSYGGKNPKQEYKRESFELFQSLMFRVKYDTIRYLSIVEISSADEVEEMRQQREAAAEASAERMALQHEQANAIANNQEGSNQKANQVPKVGRNDPCPCGSGLKYKHCHGKLS